MTTQTLGKAGEFTIYVTNGGLYFEHDEHGEDYCACVYIDGARQIYDYDMCGVLPREVGQWLHDNSYNVEWNSEWEMWDTV